MAGTERNLRLRWFDFALPSVADFLFVLLIVSLTTGAVPKHLLNDADIGWHIRNGEYILRTHSIPQVDQFSSTMSGQPWYAWEWMYDASIAAIHSWAGLNAVVFFTALVVAAAYTLLLRYMVSRGSSLLVAVPLLMLSVGSATIHLLARPHVLSWLFGIFWLEVLESWRTSASPTRDRRLWLLPLTMLLWVNLHGGFLTGLIIFGIYLGDSFWRHLSPYSEARTAGFFSLLKIFTATTLVTLANPYGYKLHTHIYEYLSDHFLIDNIQEFQSPNFHAAGPKCFALLLLIVVGSLAMYRNRVHLVHLLIILFAVFSGIYSSRNLPLSSLLLAAMIGPLLSRWIEERAHESGAAALSARSHALGARMNLVQARFRGHLWVVAVLLAGILICAHRGNLGSLRIMQANFDPERFPVAAVQFISEQGIHEPIFCPDSWGGYLIYRLYPANRVAVDDRHDFYGDEFMKDYLKILHTEPGWTELLNQKKLAWILVPAKSSLAGALRELPQSNLIYEDETAMLFHLQDSR